MEDYINKRNALEASFRNLRKHQWDNEFIHLMLIEGIELFQKSAKNIDVINNKLIMGAFLGFNAKQMAAWLQPIIPHYFNDSTRCFERKLKSKDYPTHEEVVSYINNSEPWHKKKIYFMDGQGKLTRRIPKDLKDRIWQRDYGKCTACGSSEYLEYDHIVPYSKGGETTYRNLQLLCQTCNREKADKVIYNKW